MNARRLIQLLCQGLLALSFAVSGRIPAQDTAEQSVPGYPNDVRYGFDPREVAPLPRYCISTQLFRDRFREGGREVERWTAIMGSSFNAMHHYCWALMMTNRALYLVHTERWRKFYLSLSIGEFDYVINRSPDDMVLLPEILTKKCENLYRLDRAAQAELECKRAIALKPDYWPAYAAMSDHYQTIGDLAKAREWVENGLSVKPDVTALKRRAADIDSAEGKPAPQSSEPQQRLRVPSGG